MISSKKINLIAMVLVVLSLLLVVCAMLFAQSRQQERSLGDIAYSAEHTVSLTADDYYTTYAEGGVAKINLNGTTASSSSNNVKVEGSEITVLGGGVYVVSGTLDNGNITVDSSDGAEVRLVLNGVSVTSENFSPLYVKNAGKVVLSLVEGTENVFTDTGNERRETEEEIPTAAISSKDDLTVNGKGILTVNGRYRDGIKANDTFKMTEGTLRVSAADDGINVNDRALFLDTEVGIESGGDAIKCENESEKYGFIAFEGTNLAVKSQGDGVYASSAVYANNVTASITTGGGSEVVQLSGGMERMGRGMGGFGGSRADDTPSTKAIKAGANVLVNGGTYNLDCEDDGLHSDGDMTLEGGDFTVATGDDAVHAERNLRINPKKLSITKSREGIEGAYITIDGGEISIVSSDDGINAVGENSGGFGGRPMMGGMHGGEAKTAEEDIWLTVNGGHILIEASGDGFDSNGSAMMNGGVLEIYGPENSGNGSIDVGDGGYVLIMNGGTLLAAGSSGMAETPAEVSGQNSLEFFLTETHETGKTITVIDESGNEIVSGTSSKRFNWVCVSTADITVGGKYTLTVDGEKINTVEATGTVTSSGREGRR